MVGGYTSALSGMIRASTRCGRGLGGMGLAAQVECNLSMKFWYIEKLRATMYCILFVYMSGKELVQVAIL